MFLINCPACCETFWQDMLQDLALLLALYKTSVTCFIFWKSKFKSTTRRADIRHLWRGAQFISLHKLKVKPFMKYVFTHTGDEV